MGDEVTISGVSGAPFQAGNIAGRDITINYLVQGVARATPYTRTIRTFLELYLGTEARPAPFGGRDEQMEALDQWLLKDTRPYALVTAGAGQGKSALLVHWAHRLRERGTHHVVFVPISLRLGFTAAEQVFAALAARLGEIYGEPVQSQSLSGAQWIDVALSFLDREPPDKPLVVILDGLDEAVGWEVNESLFGTSVAAGVRVVVSARYTQTYPNPADWFGRLGWRHDTAFILGIPKLSRMVLAQVVKHMGSTLKNLVGREDILNELYRLTEAGDALLVGLYVEALRAKGRDALRIRVEELQQMEPGLVGLYTRWLREQRRQWQDDKLAEQRVQVILSALATALGPVDRDTLLRVLPTNYEMEMFISLDSLLVTLDRWIVETEAGYVFNHPRLGYFFWADKKYGLPRKEQRRWNARFIEAGSQLLEELKTHRTEVSIFQTSGRAPIYLLEYYSKHLERAVNLGESVLPTQYYVLICQEWAQAWYAFRGTYDGFLDDVERAWRAAEADPNTLQSIKIQLWCALCKSSIVTQISNIPSATLAGAASTGVLSKTQAVAFIRRSSSATHIVDTINMLLGVFPHDQDLWSRLYDVVATLKSPKEQARALKKFVAWNKDAVLRLVEAKSEEKSHVEMLSMLAEELQGEVYQAAQEIVDETDRAKVLRALAPHLPREVHEAAWRMTDVANRIWILRALGSHLSLLVPPLSLQEKNRIWQQVLSVRQLGSNQIVQALVMIDFASYFPQEVYEAAQSILDEESRIAMILAVAPHLPPEEQSLAWQQALSLAQSIPRERSRTRLLSALVPQLPREVYQAAQAISHQQSRAEILSTLAPHLPQEVFNSAQLISDHQARAKVLSSLADYLPQEVYQVAHSILDDNARTKVLGALAHDLPQEIFNSAQLISDEGSRAELLTTLTPYLPYQVEQASQSVFDKRTRANVLSALAPHLSLEEQPLIWKQALMFAQSVSDEKTRTKVLGALAPYLPREVHQSAQSVSDEESRANVLNALAPHLSLEEQPLIWKQALMFAQSISDEESRANVLSALAPHLPLEVFQVAQSITQERFQAKVLGALAPYLSQEIYQAANLFDEEYRSQIISALAPYIPQEVYQDAKAILNERYRAKVLNALAPYLPQEVYQDAQLILIEEYHVEVLSALASHLPQEVYQASKSVSDWGSRTQLLSALAPHLPQEVYQTAQSIPEERYRAKMLSALAPYLPEEVYQTAQSILEERPRIEVLSAVAFYLPLEEQTTAWRQALTFAQAMPEDLSSLVVLNNVIPYLPLDVYEITLKSTDDLYKTWLLPYLVPHLVRSTQTNLSGALRLWSISLKLLANDKRDQLLTEIAILIPFIATLLAASSSTASSMSPMTLSPTQHAQLLSLLLTLGQYRVLNRQAFAEDADLAALTPDLHLDGTLRDFVQSLLRAVTEHTTAPDGEPYLAKLLRYLHDTEWVGQEDKRAFVAGLLNGGAGMDDEKSHPLYHVLEAVETVCKWWP